jgi:carbon storage regulator
MLILTRKPGQLIQIGPDITLKVVSVDGPNVKLAFTAPREIKIMRVEIIDRQPREALADIEIDEPFLRRFLRKD